MSVNHYDLKKLTLWKTSLPSVKHAILPPSNNRPNPLVTNSIVFASIFSPGAVCAIERETGKLIWRRELSPLAGAAVYLAGDRLFAQSPHTLYALRPESGELLWSFCPYGSTGETIYSSPTLYRDRLYIGDRCGFLHCLDESSGETIWRQRTNRAKNDDVNSTPLAIQGLVVVGANAKKAVAYDAKSGKVVWVQKLDGPSVFGQLLYRKSLVVLTHSIYRLESASGRVIARFSWKGESVNAAEVTAKTIIALLRTEQPAGGEMRLVGVDGTRIRFSSGYAAFCPEVRYAPETKLIYVSHLEGVDLCRPETGEVIGRLKLGKQAERAGLVEVKQNTIYLITGEGHAYAVRHPKIKK